MSEDVQTKPQSENEAAPSEARAAVVPLTPEELEAIGAQIVAALKTVYDPEIPVDIYELGLIYKVDVADNKDVTVDMVRSVLENAPGVLVVDDPDNKVFPTPIDVVDTDPTVVGRIRVSPEYPNEIDFFVCGDNLRKGAALNTAQIAEVVAKEFA